MTRPVRDWNADQSMSLSVPDFLPADHVAHFTPETVAEGLEESAVRAAYGGDGTPADGAQRKFTGQVEERVRRGWWLARPMSSAQDPRQAGLWQWPLEIVLSTDKTLKEIHG